MIYHDHCLAGCTTRPLASYLKALAVFRLVAEQKDARARGYWKDGVFHLVTSLDKTALKHFFLEEWKPTALVSPWNKGSGFFTKNDKGLTPVERSTAPRFAPLRGGIELARVLMTRMDAAVINEKQIKDRANQIKDTKAREALRADPAYKQLLARAGKECKRLKDELQSDCQRRWRGGALRWLRALVVIDADGTTKFPALLGAGGGDGRLDFTNNAFQRMADLFDLSGNGGAKAGARERLDAALWGSAVAGQLKGAIGQYAPAASGGANATSGALGESLLNPWDLLLLLEGSILFTSGSTRRLLGRSAPQAAAPFAVRGQATGYGSASRADEGVRGEQWMPLWKSPWTLNELQTLLSEGRAQLGKRPSESALDVARSVARLGVARGVTAFERYGYLERNGKSNYAVPLGLWQVRAQPNSLLLDDLEARDWWSKIRRAARDDRAPASFARAERTLADAAMSALAHGSEHIRWLNVLLALAALEAQMVKSGAFTAKQRLSPIPTLSPGWWHALAPSSEARLALCLAGAGSGHNKEGWPVNSVRSHWLPLLPGNRFNVGEKGLALDPKVVMEGRDAPTDLIALVQRRLIDSESGSSRRLPLRARRGTEASTSDLEMLLAGEVDLDRICLLARALAALDWKRLGHVDLPDSHSELEPAYLALRLTHLFDNLGDRQIPVDPALVRLLAAGQAERAFAIVLRRLQSSGLAAPIRVAVLDPALSRLFAASLAFPISLKNARRFARDLDPQTFEKGVFSCQLT